MSSGCSFFSSSFFIPLLRLHLHMFTAVLLLEIHVELYMCKAHSLGVRRWAPAFGSWHHTDVSTVINSTQCNFGLFFTYTPPPIFICLFLFIPLSHLVLCYLWFPMKATWGHSIWTLLSMRAVAVEVPHPLCSFSFGSSLSFGRVPPSSFSNSFHLSAFSSSTLPFLSRVASCFLISSLARRNLWSFFFLLLLFYTSCEHMLGGNKNSALAQTALGRHFKNCPSAKCKLTSISLALIVAGSNLR